MLVLLGNFGNNRMREGAYGRIVTNYYSKRVETQIQEAEDKSDKKRTEVCKPAIPKYTSTLYPDNYLDYPIPNPSPATSSRCCLWIGVIVLAQDLLRIIHLFRDTAHSVRFEKHHSSVRGCDCDCCQCCDSKQNGLQCGGSIEGGYVE